MKIDGILSIVLRKFKEINNDYIEDWEDILRASLFVCCGMTKQIEYNREKLIEEQKLELLDTKSKNLFVLSYVFLNDIKSIETGEIKPFYLNTLLNNLRLELK